MPGQILTRIAITAVGVATCTMLAPGCQHGRSKAPPPAAAEVFTVRIDRKNNGSADGFPVATPTSDDQPARAFAFEMAGTSPIPMDNASFEARAASQQAAVISAFVRALIETRRQRGLPVERFTERLGPRLSVHHTIESGAEVLHVRLVSRGVESVFEVRDGQLTHPPHDFEMIHRLFDETSGEFALLSCAAEDRPDQVIARVVCFLPVEAPAIFAGQPDAEDLSPAATP